MTIGPLMIDVEGLALQDEEIKRIMHPMVGGLILFTRNYKDTVQLKTLTDAIRKIRGHDFLIAVDHEGGRVQRFREGFTTIPAMRKLGEVWDKDPKRANHLAFLIGQIIATELRVFDIDFSFTPVLDIDYNESTVIRDRAFHNDIEAIKALASSILEGLKEGGMRGVGKHFPGHGYIKADSHLSVSEDERTFDEIASKDMSIFISLIKHGLNAVMPSHVLYSAVDKHPAGFSSFWLKDQLREKFHFKGAIFSDDMSMKGAILGGEMKDRILKALEAGCDMVLLCNSPQLVDEVLLHLDWKMSSENISRLLSMKGTKEPAEALKMIQEKGFKEMTSQIMAM
ncbi:beta-N-acetylhexosaminidase [Candidatus Methylopumilus rimovensis]|jgi:beta-N-acetylhexosaminidase|uniref:beta-N-acetylhexosaminidase n=1 Tax=Candidatus Methylopumilus rimovensis TaxID=2588535 RepID=UPI00111F9629|nr:beta-N-acetylhexosaminidase [Candidatus Methylopumilus rimovensis]QDD12417.1 beta-N-acetylhexosaminidase [Candidatus Methylopumilus rimovensis]